MSFQHRTALQQHCRFAFETAHPRYHFHRRGLSVVLTVNSGYE